MQPISQDLRYAIRALRRARGFTTTCIMTLAVAIAATTSVFSVVNGVVLQPLPLPEPPQVVQIHTMVEGEPSPRRSLSPPNFASLAAESRTFAAVSVLFTGDRALSEGAPEPRAVRAAQVSAGFFGVAGVRPAAGRAFTDADNAAGSAPVAVIAASMASDLFGGSALGRRIMIDGVSHQVVGIMPAGFDFPERTVVWTAYRYTEAFSASAVEGRKSNTWVPVIARVRSGLDLAAARQELASLSERIAERFPAANAGVSFIPADLRTELVGDVRRPLYLVLAGVLVVLLIASINLAGLVLARAATRQEEMAVRTALGASRGRIIQQLVIEAGVIGALGGVAGVLLAVWVTPVLAASAPSSLPRLGEVRLDGLVLAFAALSTIVATLIAGVAPGMWAARGRTAALLRSGGKSGLGAAAGEWTRGALVVGQLALAVVLLTCGGLLVRSLDRLLAVEPGFDPSNAVTFHLDARPSGFATDAEVADLFERVRREVAQVSGVSRVGAVSRLPLASGSITSRFRPGGPETEASIAVRSATPGYFDAMGIPVHAGRAITAVDHRGSRPVAVVNQAAVKRFFGGRNPVGATIGGFSYDPIEAAGETFTIVGVVGDVRHAGLDAPAEPRSISPMARCRCAA